MSSLIAPTETVDELKNLINSIPERAKATWFSGYGATLNSPWPWFKPRFDQVRNAPIREVRASRPEKITPRIEGRQPLQVRCAAYRACCGGPLAQVPRLAPSKELSSRGHAYQGVLWYFRGKC